MLYNLNKVVSTLSLYNFQKVLCRKASGDRAIQVLLSYYAQAVFS